MAVLFLAHPLGPFVVLECWSEPLLLTLIVGAILALVAQPPRPTGQAARPALSFAAATLSGLMVAAKQSNILFAPLLLTGKNGAKRLVFRSIGVAVVVTLPWLLWDPDAFLQATVFVFGDMPIRRDAFSLWTVLYREVGVQVPSWVTVGLVLLSQVWAVWLARSGPHERRLERTFAAITLSYWLLFSTGRQSFANYHFLVAGLLLIGLALRLGHEGDPTP